MSLLDEIVARVAGLDGKARASLAAAVLDATGERLWTPNPGSQTEAYFCEADEIGYGGEAGPGKTDLLIGLSLTAHRRSLILRRTNKEARKLIERYEELIGHRRGLNANEGVWRLGNRLIECGGVEHEHDKQKFKGGGHDLLGFDEVVDFTFSQYQFLKQWCRTTNPNQRCRVVATFNPPTQPGGLWVVPHWGPWLDPKHPHPAASGEIRWYTTVEGKNTEVDGPGPHMIGGESVMAKSRTFIRGYLSENPALARTGYDAVRAAAPKTYRDVYREGSFEAALADAPGQLIPTAWVRAAQARWTERAPAGIPMCAMGVDCSGGGNDPLVIATRHDGWYAPMIEVAAVELPVERSGAVSAGIVVSHRRDEAAVIVDMGGGYGGSLLERLIENGITAKGFKGAEASTRRTRDRKLGFTNKRTEVWWLFREALDPDQPGGSPIALPADSQLVADLTSPTFEVTPRGIKLEPKEEVIERLGRSTDRGDAVTMAWSAGMTFATDGMSWRKIGRHQTPVVARGHQAQKRFLRRR